MKYLISILVLLIVLISCDNNQVPDNNFKYYFTVNNFGEFDEVRIHIDGVNIQANNIGESGYFIHTLELNPVEMVFTKGGMDGNIHLLGDSSMWPMEVENVAILINGGSVRLNNITKPIISIPFQPIIENPFELLIQEGDIRSILFTMDLGEAILQVDGKYILEGIVEVSVL